MHLHVDFVVIVIVTVVVDRLGRVFDGFEFFGRANDDSTNRLVLLGVPSLARFVALDGALALLANQLCVIAAQMAQHRHLPLPAPPSQWVPSRVLSKRQEHSCVDAGLAFGQDTTGIRQSGMSLGSVEVEAHHTVLEGVAV